MTIHYLNTQGDDIIVTIIQEANTWLHDIYTHTAFLQSLINAIIYIVLYNWLRCTNLLRKE